MFCSSCWGFGLRRSQSRWSGHSAENDGLEAGSVTLLVDRDLDDVLIHSLVLDREVLFDRHGPAMVIEFSYAQ